MICRLEDRVDSKENDETGKEALKQLLQRMEDSSFIQRFEHSQEGKIILEACDKVAKDSATKLIDVDPGNIKEIIRLQERAKYGRFLKNLIFEIHRMGEDAFEEVKELKQERIIS